MWSVKQKERRHKESSQKEAQFHNFREVHFCIFHQATVAFMQRPTGLSIKESISTGVDPVGLQTSFGQKICYLKLLFSVPAVNNATIHILDQTNMYQNQLLHYSTSA